MVSVNYFITKLCVSVCILLMMFVATHWLKREAIDDWSSVMYLSRHSNVQYNNVRPKVDVLVRFQCGDFDSSVYIHVCPRNRCCGIDKIKVHFPLH